MENRIAQLRNEKNLTLKELGEILNIRDNTLSQYETGKRNPQFGLLKEMANYFNVSLEYLTCQSDKRDYPISNDEDALDLLSKLHTKEIDYFGISNETALELFIFLANNGDFILQKEEFSHLKNTINEFMERFSNSNETLKIYSEMRASENRTIDEITEKLQNEIAYTGAISDEVLEFILESERISHDDLIKTLEFMKNLPDDNT